MTSDLGKSKKDDKLTLKIDDKIIHSNVEIVNAFHDKFSALVCINNNDLVPKLNFLGESIENSMILNTVDDFDVKMIFDELSVSKATGSDGIPARVWKENAEFFIPHVTELINLIITTSTYPDIMKIAAITPIHKGGIKTEVNNYRGISLLPILNKVIEKVIFGQIEKFLYTTKQYDELQFGYRRHYGTQDALCKFLSITSKALDRNQLVIAVFLDVAKAFDSINHRLLLYKIEKMGIRGDVLKLLENYLKNRQQFVRIGTDVSNSHDIFKGVAQGSNGGPDLFNMVLYDMKFLNTNSTILKFADDTVMILTCDKNSSPEPLLMNDMNKIMEYYEDNGLKLNLNKSKYMIIGNNLFTELDDYMHENSIEKVKNMKYLGIFIDNKLKFGDQADALVKKLSQSINAMRIVRNYLPEDLLRLFYHSYVGSHLFYCGFMLCRFKVDDINRLQRIQNKALKFAYNLERRYSTIDLFTNFAVDILPVLAIGYFNLLLLVKKNLLSGESDFEEIQDGRRCHQLKYSRYHKNVFAMDFLCLGPVVYNQLPVDIRKIQRYYQFKKKLKKFLLENKQIFLRGTALNVNKIFES